jgi:hypothetical protein
MKSNLFVVFSGGFFCLDLFGQKFGPVHVFGGFLPIPIFLGRIA